MIITESQKDIIDTFLGNDDRDTFLGSSVAADLRDRGVNVEAAWDQDLVPPSSNNNQDDYSEIQESDLYRRGTDLGDAVYEASKIHHDHAYRVNKYENAAQEEAERGIGNVSPRAFAAQTSDYLAARDRSDEDIATYGIELAGNLNYNMASGLINWAKIDDMPREVALSTAVLLEQYDALPNWTWAGTSRMLRGLGGDPFTYVGGVAGLKVVQQLLRGGGMSAAKNRLMKVALGVGAGGAVASEGAAYAAFGEYLNQRLKHGQETPDSPFVPDWNAVGTAAGLGGGLGAGLVGGAAVARQVPSAVKAVKDSRVVRDLFDAPAEAGTTLTSGVDPTPAIEAALSYASRLAKGEQPVRSEGGLAPNPEKASNELRLHSNRLAAAQDGGKPYPGAPKNPRTVIKAPADSDLPDVVIGQIRPDDWQQRIEKAMSPDEINEAATWYKKVFAEFRKQAGGDPKEMAKLTDAWFAGQQNSNPSQTLNDVLFVYEQIKRGVKKEDLKGKGLPSANKIVFDILTGGEVSGGAGQKISDFLDSGYDKNVRSFMNNDPMGGSPFVVDVHTARDTGLVDPVYLNHLNRLGYDVPENVITDFGQGGIKGPMYESRALFGKELTDHLNNQNWIGRSDWEPAEIQAIGWMQLSSMYGQSNTGGDISDAFAVNTRRISMEVDPGEGSPWASKFGQDYTDLSDADKISINDAVTARAIELVNKQQGIELGQVVHGTGGWEMFQNASTVQQAIASKQSAVEAAARLGLLLNQTEVWVNAPKAMTKNPKHFAVDIIEDGAETLRDSGKLRELFGAITEADQNELFRGYQPVLIDGKPGIRILIDDTAIKNSPLSKAKAQEYIMGFADKQLTEITDNLDMNVEVDIMEADLTKLRNDWTKDKDGGGYKNYLSRQSGEDAVAGGSVLDTDRGELENLFGRLINESKNRGSDSAE